MAFIKRQPAVKTRMTYEKKKSMVGFLFILPWGIGTVYFLLIPVVMSIVFSISNLTITPGDVQIDLVGLKNYSYIFTEDPNYVRLMVTSLKDMAIHVPVVVMFSLFIAILLNQRFIGRTVTRVVFFLPVIIANGIIISIINGDVFSQMLMESSGASQLMKSDFLNVFLLESGVSSQLVQILTTFVNSIFFLVWKSGIQILIFLAGLQTISASMYEAAKMEGGSNWEIFWFVTFPIISPVILLNIVYSLIDYFTDYTNKVMTYINEFALSLYLEKSQAMAWCYFLIVLLIVLTVYLIVAKRVFYHE